MCLYDLNADHKCFRNKYIYNFGTGNSEYTVKSDLSHVYISEK